MRHFVEWFITEENTKDDRNTSTDYECLQRHFSKIAFQDFEKNFFLSFNFLKAGH